MKVVWYAVRCCCSPKKIFGFIMRPANEGPCFTVTLLQPMPISFEHFNDPREVKGLERHTIKIREMVGEGTGRVERAIYSDDRPIDFWRQVPGFIEVKDAP